MESQPHSSTDRIEEEEKPKIKNKSARLKKTALIFIWALGVLAALLIFGYYFFLQPLPDKTRLLVLGSGGESHTGGKLTDTVIFISFNAQTGQILALSLPRDIWLPALRTKLNSVYFYRGLAGTEEAVSEILAQPIDHAFLINFDGFVQIIDVLGGVEVEIERSFDDYFYPIPGRENDLCDGDPEFKCRYEHLHFEAGVRHLDGERALKYVRSRYSESEEGTDFARSQRQQKLLLAVKNKIFSFSTLSRPRTIIQLAEVTADNLETDLSPRDLLKFIKVLLKGKKVSFRTEVLKEEFLVNPPPSERLYDGQWVLIPRAGDWQEVQKYLRQLLN